MTAREVRQVLVDALLAGYDTTKTWTVTNIPSMPGEPSRFLAEAWVGGKDVKFLVTIEDGKDLE